MTACLDGYKFQCLVVADGATVRGWKMGLSSKRVLKELALNPFGLSAPTFMSKLTNSAAQSHDEVFPEDFDRRAALQAIGGIGVAVLASNPVLAAASAVALDGSQAIVPFRIAVPQADIDDLRSRLASTRWPERETVADASQGAQLDKVQALVRYWQNNYDWRAVETKLNSYPQFKTEIDGLGIHFFHIRSNHENAIPLVMTHGWPGSVIEFLETIEPLVNPTAHGGTEADAFHVVLPSLPGYGFSDKPSAKGWGRQHIAKAWAELMRRLGYTKYVAQGGDWGSVVTTEMARQKVRGLVAVHVNLPFVVPAVLPTKPNAEEKIAIDQVNLFASNGADYHRLQVTRPQTLGYSLADSPSGQAAWIYEKLAAWSDSDGQPEKVFGYDKMLDNISFYWLTNSGASSARMYAENFDLSFVAVPLELPAAVTVFPKEIFTPPKAWAQKTYKDLYYWNRVAKGGHFAAFEQPQLFVQELRKAFQGQRKAFA